MKIRRIMAMAVIGAAFWGCEEKGPVQEMPEEAQFSIEVYDISAVSATVEVEPLDQEAPYYTDIITDSDFSQANLHGFDDYMAYILEKLENQTGMTRSEVVEMITSYGNDGFITTSLTPETTYHAFAVGIDSDGKTTTDPVTVKFRTTAAPQAATTFSISVSENTSGTAAVSVQPSDDAPYVFTIEPYTVTSGLSDEELADFIIQDNLAWGGLEDLTHSGAWSEEYTGRAGWEYEAIAFGYSDGMATTEVTRCRFTMADGGAPSECEFTFAQEFGDFQMNLSVSPSDNSVVYVANVLPASDLAALAIAEGSIEAGLAKNLEDLIEEIVQDCGSRARAVDIITTMGALDYSLGFSSGESYIQWAVPVSQDGIPTAEFSYSETFTAPADNVSDATLTLKKWAYYDGTELAELYPEDFGKAKGYAVVDMTVEASSTASVWRSYVTMEDITDRTREVIIKNIEMAPTEPNLTRQLIVAFWGVSTIMGVAQDADGAYGPLMLEVVNLDKTAAAPASELVLP